jgi:hypothetical protein
LACAGWLASRYQSQNIRANGVDKSAQTVAWV